MEVVLVASDEYLWGQEHLPFEVTGSEKVAAAKKQRSRVTRILECMVLMGKGVGDG